MPCCNDCDGFSNSHYTPFYNNNCGDTSKCLKADSSCIVYTGPELAYLGVSPNTSVENIFIYLDNLISNIAEENNNLSFFPLCMECLDDLEEGECVNSLQEWITMFSSDYCTLKGDYLAWKEVINQDIIDINLILDELQHPNLSSCAFLGVVNTDSTKEVDEKQNTAICSLYDYTNLENIQWGSGAPTISNTEDAFEYILSLIGTGSKPDLPQFDNTAYSSCLILAVSATDTLEDTVINLRNTLCDLKADLGMVKLDSSSPLHYLEDLIQAGTNMTITKIGGKLVFDASGGGEADGYIKGVSLSGNSLDFTGVSNAYNGSVDLSSLRDYISNIVFDTNTNILSFTGLGNAFSSTIDLSSLAGGGPDTNWGITDIDFTGNRVHRLQGFNNNILVGAAPEGQSSYLAITDTYPLTSLPTSGDHFLFKMGGLSHVSLRTDNLKAAHTQNYANVDGTFVMSVNGETPDENGNVNLNISPGGLSSVGLSITNNTALQVTNSPLTSNGTLALSWTGTDSQYIKGDGTLGVLPNNSSELDTNSYDYSKTITAHSGWDTQGGVATGATRYVDATAGGVMVSVLDTDHVIVVDARAGSTEIFLPDPSLYLGRILRFKIRCDGTISINDTHPLFDYETSKTVVTATSNGIELVIKAGISSFSTATNVWEVLSAQSISNTILP